MYAGNFTVDCSRGNKTLKGHSPDDVCTDELYCRESLVALGRPVFKQTEKEQRHLQFFLFLDR